MAEGWLVDLQQPIEGDKQREGELGIPFVPVVAVYY